MLHRLPAATVPGEGPAERVAPQIEGPVPGEGADLDSGSVPGGAAAIPGEGPNITVDRGRRGARGSPARRKPVLHPRGRDQRAASAVPARRRPGWGFGRGGGARGHRRRARRDVVEGDGATPRGRRGTTPPDLADGG